VRFERLVLPRLDAAVNLARWLLRSGADAEDFSQEAVVRAHRFFHGFHGGDVRAWLLQIVRNTCLTWLDKYRHVKDMTEFDEELHGPLGPNPESFAIAANSHERLTQALESLPRLSGGDRAMRAARMFLQGDRHHYFHFHRNGNVQGFPCTPAASVRAR
jgi:RNA polymerase sigma factor (sigma-70 family)